MRVDDRRIGHVLDAQVALAVPDDRPHRVPPRRGRRRGPGRRAASLAWSRAVERAILLVEIVEPARAGRDLAGLDQLAQPRELGADLHGGELRENAESALATIRPPGGK